jgi:hypothetical protein
MSSLAVEPGGTLLVDNVQGPVRVFVHGAFTFRGAVTEQDPTLGTTLFAVSGNQGVFLASSFSGVVFAPLAPVVIASTSTPHVGAFFGASVDLQGCQSPASWSQVPTVSPPSWSHPIARVMEPPRGWA